MREWFSKDPPLALEYDPLDKPVGGEDVNELRAAERSAQERVAADAEDPRPEIEVTTNEHAVNDQAIAALAGDGVVYQVHGMGLVHVVRDTGEELAKSGRGRPRGAPRIGLLPKATLRERLTSCARWWHHDKRRKAPVYVHPPGWAIDAVYARGTWPGVRRLEGIVEVPALRADGSLVDVEGYDAATGLCYLPSGQVLPVTDTPTLDDARCALAELGEIIVDFPFAGEPHRAGWLASLLTPIAMAGQDWPAPLFLFDANTRGSGKTLLADLVALLLTGRQMPRMTLSVDKEEARKALFALALGGETLAFFDEAEVLRGHALNAALTGRVIRDRVLGESREATATLRATFYAAGNNVQVRGDTTRRVIHVRLESRLEHPEDRSGFRHSDVKSWVLAERPRLLRAALTILRAHHVAGRPAAATALGGFEGWSVAVRNPLVWAGAGDPCATRKALLDSDPEENLLRQLLAGWVEIAGTEAITVHDVAGRLQRSTVLRAVLEELGALSGSGVNARTVGNRLARCQGRWCGGRCLVKAGVDRKGVALWRIESAESADSAESISLPFARERTGTI